MQWPGSALGAAIVLAALASACSPGSHASPAVESGPADATTPDAYAPDASAPDASEDSGDDSPTVADAASVDTGTDAGTDGARVCGHAEDACQAGGQCCSSVCEAGTCGFGSRGQPCAIDNDCFGGTCVGGACACVTDSVTGVIPYQADNVPTICRADSDCCSGHCGLNQTEEVFRGQGRVCCLAPGAACTDLTQCCSDRCTGGICQCTTTGNCLSASDCCTGQCNAGTCLACFHSGACTADVQCCSGTCSGGMCTTPVVCTPNCGGRSCGPDGCGNHCGFCQAGQACNSNSGQCQSTCTPSCAGRTCGADGCGGICGSGASGQGCDASGQCVGSGSGSGSGGGGGGTCPNETPCVTAYTTGGICSDYEGIANNCGQQVTCHYTLSDGTSGCIFPLPGSEDCGFYDPNYESGQIVCVPTGNVACENAIGCQ